MLDGGGSAVDAALAAMCAATVAEPVLCSVGGGGFLLYRASSGERVLFDFFVHTPKVRAPEATIEFNAVHADFGTTLQEFHIGRGSMATPGFVDGLFHIHERLGRLPMTEIVKPAVEAATAGVVISDFQGRLFEIVRPIYLSTPEAQALFGRENGTRLIEAGEVFRNPDLGGFFVELAHQGPGFFYEGELARQVSDACRECGHLRRADFLDYRTVEREPLLIDFRGFEIATNPPPSLGGLLAAVSLATLRDIENLDASDVINAFQVTEQFRRTDLPTAARGERILTQREIEGLLQDHTEALSGTPQNPRGTTHISVIDEEGNACAVTLSNGEGAGYIVPGTGIMMNNMLGEEDLMPDGFHQWPTDRRMGSMMMPSILSAPETGQVMALGSGGSNRIRTAMVQVLLKAMTTDASADHLVDAPRCHWENGKLDLEPGFPDPSQSLLDAPTSLTWWPEKSPFFGGVHMVSRDHSGHVDGAGDPRRAGVFKAIT